ncbi:MAG: type III restriction endonuclease subunit M [Aequorivita sp.]|nr:type III restriction endonuclease subunit M [Aequorivita sp.]|tara:strand:- start:147762 stop:149417 length:1656 start_codon:yes stop_codon:yes gene_type:complete
MPTLNWIGKEKVISHHQDVPYRVLEHKYGFTAVNGEQNEPTNSGNKIIHGDNLEALKSLLPEYEGKVKCIYIDPPYNTGNKDWVYNDNVDHPKMQKWLQNTLKAKAENKDATVAIDDLTRHDKWLCMMYPRLKLLQKLLDENGAIFISIDDNEQANLKMICDEIFGIRNFVGTYFWYKSGTPPNLSHKIKRNIEYVICYSKTPNSNKFTGVQKTSKSDDPITKPQNSYKELTFKPKSLTIGLKDGTIKAGTYGTAKFPNELLNDLIIKDGTNQNEVRFRNRFIWVQDKLNEELENETLVKINSKSLVISYKKQNYAKEVPPNFIDSSVGVDTTENAGRMLNDIFGKKVFDFPKPPSLIEYIANFLCEKDDIILDSFAGSGTTAHAVLNLNKQDGGNRKFILVEMEDYANDITAERVKRVAKGYGEGKKAVEGTGGAFDYYELGLPLFDENQNLNEEVGLPKIREYIWFSETRTSFAEPNAENYFLGKIEESVYYFIYEKDRLTTLDYDALELIKTKGEQYIIYADNCLLPKEFMAKKNIIFKKIPRDITRF